MERIFKFEVNILTELSLDNLNVNCDTVTKPTQRNPNITGACQFKGQNSSSSYNAARARNVQLCYAKHGSEADAGHRSVNKVPPTLFTRKL
jgi:hypothetical protein